MQESRSSPTLEKDRAITAQVLHHLPTRSQELTWVSTQVFTRELNNNLQKRSHQAPLEKNRVRKSRVCNKQHLSRSQLLARVFTQVLKSILQARSQTTRDASPERLQRRGDLLTTQAPVTIHWTLKSTVLVERQDLLHIAGEAPRVELRIQTATCLILVELVGASLPSSITRRAAGVPLSSAGTATLQGS